MKVDFTRCSTGQTDHRSALSKAPTKILLLLCTLTLNACSREHHNLKTETIGEAETKAVLNLTYGIAMEALKRESVPFAPIMIEVSGKGDPTSLFKYKKDMDSLSILVLDRNIVNDLEKQKAVDRRMRQAAKIVKLGYKDKEGRERDIRLVDFDISYPTSPKDRTTTNGPSDPISIIIVPTSIRITAPSTNAVSVGSDEFHKVLQEEFENPKK